MPSHPTTPGLTAKQPAKKVSAGGFLFARIRGKLLFGNALFLFHEYISVMLLRGILRRRLQ
jgi:hypothetical protein